MSRDRLDHGEHDLTGTWAAVGFLTRTNADKAEVIIDGVIQG